MKNILILLALSMLSSSCLPDYEIVEIQKYEIRTTIDTIYYYKVKDGTRVHIETSKHKYKVGDTAGSWDF